MKPSHRNTHVALLNTVARLLRENPEALPESEFPLHCPSCSYDLTGLVNARCPECGTSFDRASLLTDQYGLHGIFVLPRRAKLAGLLRAFRRFGRTVLFPLALIAMFIPVLLTIFGRLGLDLTASMSTSTLELFLHVYLGIFAFVLLCYAFSVLLDWMLSSEVTIDRRKKRERIFERLRSLSAEDHKPS